MTTAQRPSEVLRKPVPGTLWPWVKIASYIELVLFAGLLIVWLSPGMDRATFYFGLSHGIGFIILALMVWAAVLRWEAPYTLLAATLTPAGPVGAVIGITWIEHRRRAATPGVMHAPRSTTQNPLPPQERSQRTRR